MTKLSRREFIRLSGLGVCSLIAKPTALHTQFEEANLPAAAGRGRVTTTAIYVYSQPDFKSERLGMLRRDELVTIYHELFSEHGPSHNKRWYELMNGYIHSAYIQRIDHAYLYPKILQSIPEVGCLGEITVPFTDSMRRLGTGNWQRLYRLYYQTVFWITGLLEGPDGKSWYQLTDDLLHVRFCIPTMHIRPIKAEEISPISTQIDESQKRIEISLDDQTLTAFEGSQIMLHTHISTGIPASIPSSNGIPTDTPSGRFHIQTKMPSRHMGNGELTNDIESYELLGVPWVCFFHKDGLALHGTYWHDNFGRKMSHGCVNLRNQDALWLYRWTTPVAEHQDWYCRGMGTQIDIV
jgi:hypothetical protein